MLRWYLVVPILLLFIIATPVAALIVNVGAIGGLAMLLFLPVSIVFVHYLACGGHNRRLAAHIARHRHGVAELPATAYICELHLLDRLPRPGLQRLDNADDLGAVIIAEDRLQFLGDACSISLTREQIAAIETFGRSGELGYLGAKTRVTLNQRLSGQISFCVTIREGVPIWKSWRRARDLQNTLMDWHIGDESEQLISSVAVAPEPAGH
jgi:hypothetical protein